MPRGRKSAVDAVGLRCPCEWSECGLLFNNLSILQEHQLDHFKELYSNVNLSYFITCRICEVQLDASDFDAIERHSHYHVWTLSLRVLGRHVQQINEWPDCLHTPDTCNVVPDLPTKFDCAWQYCSFTTNDVFVFYDHVSGHPEEYTDSRYAPDTPLRCLWGGCGYIANWLKNLHSHLDMHTQRKHIGCPTCGMLFANRIKFEDHLKRQQVMMLDEPPGPDGSSQLHPSVNPVSCYRCHRVFATERLLMAHMKRHINKIKCQFCDMTVWGKTELDRHVLFRHTDERRFPCPQCDHRSKTNSALKSHMERMHSARATTSTPRILPKLAPNVDLDASAYIPIKGPLAAAGAISLFDGENKDLVNAVYAVSNPGSVLAGSSSITTTTITTNNSNNITITANDTVLNNKSWIYCDQPGCTFKTTHLSGFKVHYNRKHLPRTSPEPSSNNEKIGYYMCHLCPEMKKHSQQMTRHLIRDHQLARPPGHTRFMYSLGGDGKFRLQTTRLDTVPVATALLGKVAISRLLKTAAPSSTAPSTSS